MTQAGASDLNKLQKGALVLGTDLEIGALEEVKPAEGSQGARLIVRHGYADYLLAIPADAIEEAQPTRIRLNMQRQDAEMLIYEEKEADAGFTSASPDNPKVIGAPEPELPGGPSTG
jgi:hypothetical protein